MTELEFNTDNQEEQMKILENLTSDLNLNLKFRHRLLTLPCTALNITNCGKKCFVRLHERSMDITLRGNFSKNQLNYINLYSNCSDEFKISKLKEDWKNNITNRDQSWRELIEINECLRSILKGKGKIFLENKQDKIELKFSIPWLKTANNKK